MRFRPMHVVTFIVAGVIAAPASLRADGSSQDSSPRAGGRAPAVAQANPGKEASDKGRSPSERQAARPLRAKPMPPGLTPEREAAAMTFVRQHHAELVELLLYLKDQKPAAYRQAILDLFRASERLALWQERDYERYELDLALWKTESRIELLAARLKMAGQDSPEGESLRGRLRRLLEDRHELRRERLALDRRRAAERVEKLDKQLSTMKTNRDQTIQRELRRLADPSSPNP